jgi:butyrate kinase
MAGVPAYVVDPVSTDEFDDVSRISGAPRLPRRSLLHALNHKAVARLVAAEMGMDNEDARFIISHMGTGISTVAHLGGRMVDGTDPANEGAFSADRAGSLPTYELVKLCFSGKYSREEAVKMVNGEGGMVAYTGTRDLRKALENTERDADTRIVVEAMAYQISKDIASLSVVFGGKLDRIILTGGMARSEKLTDMIRRRVEFLAPVKIVPGEMEMEALALGALRALRSGGSGPNRPKKYAEGTTRGSV